MWPCVCKVYDEIESLDISEFPLEYSHTPAPTEEEVALQPVSYVTVARELLRTFIGSSQILSSEHRSRVAAANATKRRTSSTSGGSSSGAPSSARAARLAAEAATPHSLSRTDSCSAGLADSSQSQSQSQSQQSLKPAPAAGSVVGDKGAGTAPSLPLRPPPTLAVSARPVGGTSVAEDQPSSVSSRGSAVSSPRTGAVSLDGPPVSAFPPHFGSVPRPFSLPRVSRSVLCAARQTFLTAHRRPQGRRNRANPHLHRRHGQTQTQALASVGRTRRL